MSTTVSSLRRRTDRFGYLFVAAALCFLAFLAIPILYALLVSFRREQVVGLGLGEGGRTEVWAGLRNYAGVLADSEFLAGAGRVLVYGLVLVPVMLGLALLFALLLDSKQARMRRIARIAIFLPYAVPAVISSLLWGFLYLPGTSRLPLPRRGRRREFCRTSCRRSWCCWRSRTSGSGAAPGSTWSCSTRPCGPSPASSTRRPPSTAARSCRRRFASRCR